MRTILAFLCSVVCNRPFPGCKLIWKGRTQKSRCNEKEWQEKNKEKRETKGKKK
jgi:hypothetical protein